MSPRQAPLPATRIALALGLLGLFYIALPIRLPATDDDRSSEGCLSLADRPPLTGPDALAQLERCRSAVPDDVELIADLGSAYEAVGRIADAEAAYRQVVALDPDDADVRVRLARLLISRGDTRAAAEHAAAALRVQPNRQAVTQLIHPPVTP